MKKNTIILIVIIVIAIIAIGGYFAYQKLSVSKTKAPLITNPTAGWKTYDNFGIEFQYPNNWGNPQESIFGSLGQESISFNLGTSDYQPFSVYTQQDNSAMGNPGNETFDQMISRWLVNDKYIYLVKDVSVNGINGKELFYNSATTGKPYHLEAAFPLSNGFYISLGADLASVPQDIFDKVISSFKIDASSQVKTDPATGMLIYKNSPMEFEYPAKFNTDYISLTLQTMVLNQGDSKIDSNRCYIDVGPEGAASKPQIMTINNVIFCLTTGSDVGAGQAYNSYYYATLNNGKYYVIEYLVHSPNACGGYENSPDVNAPGNEEYKACMQDEGNWDNIVTKPIQNSIATFKFINQ